MFIIVIHMYMLVCDKTYIYIYIEREREIYHIWEDYAQPYTRVLSHPA